MTVYYARTDVGCRRKHNEDSFLCDSENGVFVVADGVGGRAAGEVASALTVETFQHAAPMLQESLLGYSMKPNLETRNLVLEALDETCQQASRRWHPRGQSPLRRRQERAPRMPSREGPCRKHSVPPARPASACAAGCAGRSNNTSSPARPSPSSRAACGLSTGRVIQAFDAWHCPCSPAARADWSG